MRKSLVNLLIAASISSFPAWAQRGAGADPSPRSITGQVRLENRPAPQGVLVFLDYPTAGGSAVPSSRGELARVVTDSGGRFVFDHVELIGQRGGKERYAVSAHFAGYKDAFDIADLTFAPRAFVNIEMHPEASRDNPNVPPGGPAEAVSARGPATPDAQAAMTKAEQELVQDRNPKASIDDFKKVVQLDPQYEPAYLLLGTAYMQTQEYGEAESAFQKATKLDPNDAVAFLGIGASLNQRGNYDSAEKPILRSLELNPNYVEAHCELGRSLWALGKWQEAEPHVRKSLELNKEFPPAHLLMGNIYLRKRDANAALSEFQEYLRLDPQGQHAEAARQMVAKIQKALETK